MVQHELLVGEDCVVLQEARSGIDVGSGQDHAVAHDGLLICRLLIRYLRARAPATNEYWESIMLGGGRPETALINAGGVQMSKRYGLPSSPGSMASMSKMIGPWIGHEHTLVPLTMALVHGMSYSTQFRMNETLIRKAHMPVQSEAGQSVNPSDGRLSIPKQTQRGEIPKESYWR